KRPSKNRCCDSSFINQSSGGSPWVDDCRVVTHNIAGGGTWTTLTLTEHRELDRHACCRFGVRAVATGGAWDFTVGNQDIINLINDWINRFQHEGRVGSKGNMHCGSTEVD
ncbi:Ecp2 effector protein, partial [Panaeolus papilionaceus]